ncbi:MAG: hypothetical protein COA94_07860 [Rickettsiales bacterium]|nr:MAG: hypothetical protein COA94_07860 [Rickettsiales bacterium]
MKSLILQEFRVQDKIYNLIKYSLIFFIFCSLSITLINSYENVQIFGVVFSVICIPLAFINLSAGLIKPDIEDGSLEILLTAKTPIKIVMAKYIALFTCFCLSFAMLLPLIYIIYNIPNTIFILIAASGFLLISLCAALAVLIASIQGYFRANTNFLSIIIMPLVIPSIILSGIIIQNPDNLHLLAIMIGINLIVIPPSIYLSGYLVENIYNI